MSYHTVVIVGYVGRDPEMRYLPSGQTVTDFSVATSRKYSNSDGQQVDETCWFRVTAWGKLAEIVNEYLKKGRLVLVEGRLKPDLQSGSPRVYERKDGTWGSSFEITAGTVQFLGGKGDALAEIEEPGNHGTAGEEDIPF